MDSRLEFIYKRHSVRKFREETIPKEDLTAILEAAIQAPSGKNVQNWHFVVINNRETIQRIAEIVDQKNAYISQCLKDEQQQKMFRGSVKYHTIFAGAPTLILIYAGPYKSIAPELIADGMPEKEVKELFKANPGIQNIAAAMENLQLSAAALGYGTCWMTGPTYAAQEITELIEFAKEGYYLAAMTPIGRPLSDKATNPPRKPLSQVTTIID